MWRRNLTPPASLDSSRQAAVDSGLRLVTVDAKPAPPRGEAAFAADVLQVLGEVNCGARCQLWAKSDALVHETNAISSGTTRTGYVLARRGQYLAAGTV